MILCINNIVKEVSLTFNNFQKHEQDTYNNRVIIPLLPPPLFFYKIGTNTIFFFFFFFKIFWEIPERRPCIAGFMVWRI